MISLGWYLAQIESGNPVSKRSFLKSWNAVGLSTRLLGDVFKFGPRDRFPVSVVNDELFQQLLKTHGRRPDLTNRETAAIGGFSHRVNVAGSVIVIRSEKHPHPEVVLFDANEYSAPRPLARGALIVENLQNFLKLKRLLDFACKYTDLPQRDVEVIWSDGNAINNRHHHDFLKSFDMTYWLVDADVGGLTILSNCLGYLPDDQVQILFPDDIGDRLVDHGEHIDDKERDSIVRIANKHPHLRTIADKMYKLSRQLEQETYLLEDKEK